MRRAVWLLLLASAGTPAIGHASQPDADFRILLAQVAEDARKLLQHQGETSVAIGRFVGPQNFPASGGPGLALGLSEELRKKEIQIDPKARFTIKGQYRLIEMRAADSEDVRLGRKVLGCEVEAIVADQFDKPLGNAPLTKQMRGEATLLRLFGILAALPTDGNITTERERDSELRKRLFEPKFAARGSFVRSKEGSPFAVEILTGGKGRLAKEREGLPYVNMERGEQFAVRLTNEAPFQVGVQLWIDGLNVFAFSRIRYPDKFQDDRGKTIDHPKRGEPLYAVVFVPPKKDGKPGEAIVRGWHLNRDSIEKFSAAGYVEGAPDWLKPNSDFCTITATIQAAWVWGGQAPMSEPARSRCGMGDTRGHGLDGDKEIERDLGVIRDCVSVRISR